MNLNIENVVQKGELIDLVGSLLHEGQCSAAEFREMFFKCNVKRCYFEGKQDKKFLGLFSRMVCPEIMTELMIGPVAACSTGDHKPISDLFKNHAIFFSAEIDQSRLKLEMGSGTVQLELLPETVVSLRDISEPSRHDGHVFWGYRAAQFDDLDKLTQNTTI